MTNSFSKSEQVDHITVLGSCTIVKLCYCIEGLNHPNPHQMSEVQRQKINQKTLESKVLNYLLTIYRFVAMGSSVYCCTVFVCV